MKISDILKKKAVTFSCEIFPPKPTMSLEESSSIISGIAKVNPDFISVTYGAGGSNSKRTISIASEIQNEHKVISLAHLTCISSDKKHINNTLDEFKKNNIKNILALRGDVPQNSEDANKKSDYTYAYELIKQIKDYGDFCVGGACYPEGHIENPSKSKDIEYLKYKADAGVDFLTTQMFFDNNILYNFMYKMLSKNINIPIIAGIMPVTNVGQINRICALSGTQLPPRFKTMVDKFGDKPEAMRQAGIAYATEQIIDLISNDVTGIHLYTMNKPSIAKDIMDNLSFILN